MAEQKVLAGANATLPSLDRYGKADPITDNQTSEGRAGNRCMVAILSGM